MLTKQYALFGSNVEFYVDEAKKSDAPVLELGCGTGRILIPTAENANQ